MTFVPKSSAFTLIEILAALFIVAILISMSQSVRFGSLTSYSDKARLERIQHSITNVIWTMTIAPDRPIATVELTTCNDALILVGAGGLVAPTEIKCPWGQFKIDPSGSLSHDKN